MGGRRLRFGLVGVLALALGACGLLPGAGGAGGPGATGAVPPLSSSGRWLTDATGRVVDLHGLDEVAKSAPFTPAAFGFGDDDAAFLAAEGFTAVRVGVVPEALMPAPGTVDEGYVDEIASTVDVLARHGIYSILDLHQDQWGPVTHGNGMPAWMTITDGLPNPAVGFPAGYVEDPALQRAFDHFWADDPGPDGVGLQEHYVAALGRLAARFAHQPYLVGYEVMNEPWPGTDWSPCLTGCPQLEAELLVPFYEKATAAIRRHDHTHLVLEEPFVLFNFGAPTTLPASGPPAALAVHDYAATPTAERAVLDQAVAAADRAGTALLVTEWGATADPTTLRRVASELDDAAASWLEWAYDNCCFGPGDPQSVLLDRTRPPTPDNVNQTTLDALVRPYPLALTGVPTRIAFDPATGTFDLDYTTRAPDGHRYPRWLASAVSVPARQYPDGYTATVDGAVVTSPPCAPTLALRTLPHAASVHVQVVRGGACPSP